MERVHVTNRPALAARLVAEDHSLHGHERPAAIQQMQRRRLAGLLDRVEVLNTAAIMEEVRKRLAIA